MNWWTPRPVPQDTECTVTLGALSLRVAREGPLFRIGTRYGDESSAEPSFAQGAIEPIDSSWRVRRIVGPDTQAPLTIAPIVPDRPIVARPEVPFSVAPRGEIAVFINTPIWVSVSAGGPLVELPTVPVKPTWFGSTREGSECYGMRTRLRMQLDRIVHRPHRAVALVRIRNDGADALEIERVRVPSPSLPIHADHNGDLWLPEIVLTRHEGQQHAELSYGAPRAEVPLAPAREPMPDRSLFQAFNAMLR